MSAVIIVAVVGIAWVGLGQQLDLATAEVADVLPGPMVEVVEATGRLRSSGAEQIVATQAGRVAELEGRPGDQVAPGGRVIRLENADVELQLLEAGQRLAAARASLTRTTADLALGRLAQRGAEARANSELSQRQREDSVSAALSRLNLEASGARVRARELLAEAAVIRQAEEERGSVLDALQRRLLGEEGDQLRRLESVVAGVRRRVAALDVRSHVGGQLQQIEVQLGQWVNPGQRIASVVRAGTLTAFVAVPEHRAADVGVGQRARVSVGGSVVRAVVSGVAPIVERGTVEVQLRLEGKLPATVRAEQSVDARIEVRDVPVRLWVKPPSHVEAGAVARVFVLSPAGDDVTSRSVTLGQRTADGVEVLSGLRRGERVVVRGLDVRWPFARIHVVNRSK
ncbi:MAG: HlyD family efflux transporter periplasmic adaptor subunit [Gemmatimonadaceae bacterium]|nr:HlyD family efflux transporter periplasmic adaptor subunit [Gemmatimonadaceae bacterium]